MSAEERDLRSELKKLLSGQGVIRGSLVRRYRVCGQPNCKCARGEKHEGLYLAASNSGKLTQLYIPKDWEEVVEQWVDNYQQARKLLEDISLISWQKVRDRRS